MNIGWVIQENIHTSTAVKIKASTLFRHHNTILKTFPLLQRAQFLRVNFLEELPSIGSIPFRTIVLLGNNEQCGRHSMWRHISSSN